MATCKQPQRTRNAMLNRQRGAVAVVAAIWVGVAIAALGAIDVGNTFYARRALQRTADLAATAAAETIGSSGGCAAAGASALANAQANGFTVDGPANPTKTLTTNCGRWDSTATPYFGTTGNPLNAAQVLVTQQVPYFFLGPKRTISATATARATNIDAFSLGTGIATINTQQSALLNAILGGLLGTKVSLSVGDTQSLAAAQISLQNLMVALNASTMQGLLATTVTYQDFVAAMVKALTVGGDTIDATLLGALGVAIPGGQNIAIGDGGTSAPGLLALGLANASSAATATVNVLDALMVAAQIAQTGPNGTPGPVINVSAGLAGVAGVSLQVIHPPVLAVGEGGTYKLNGVATPRTQARTAVVNANVTLLPVLFSKTPLTLGLGSLLSVSISALSTPLVLSLTAAQGTATLMSVDCENTKAKTNAVINVTPSIATVCLSGNSTCTGQINVASISTVILGISTVIASVALNPINLTIGPGTTPLTFTGASGSFDSIQSANSNAVGTDGSVLTTQLLAQLPNALQVVLLGSTDLSSLLSAILSGVAGLLGPVLQPVFGLLDTVLVPTLSLLGIQIGTATVHNMSLMCGVPQLVN
ncbi:MULTISPECIES: TadG family pilus assembly protein [Paraburkholderia]|uniref:TadG family pilus assembly protein n=1 Tax=Paraburkholderia TaxID=1822464 RepID=UPI00224D0B77|nr:MULTISPECIES: TadG family pilus assembly protein [Paraburkholderia]MCX4164447.1 TadG family pilus assembly protein [Paraburkholderia megapolitana]MDN7159940.1 pilus assembly protein TadG-related protein [Paraburkholderia sp. CHISQ3]MDQ6496987.1 pilus assembly protein TadG-related protein [Paraburkholderia megapolitana]